MSNTAIEVVGLAKSYDDRPVLRDVTFTVDGGEIFGIAGRNGAGKTTTVETLQGLRRRDGGQVAVLGIDPARDRTRLRPLLGAQLQTSALPERLRVGEALALFARLSGNVVDWRALAGEWGLADVLRKPFGTLSGGQRQRLFLALALVNDPQIVFLDELTQGLDPVARRETWRLIELVRERGATVVLVTHDMDEAERLCDRLIVIDEGEVLAAGRPADVAAAVAGPVRMRFASPCGAVLGGLESVAGVSEVAYDGRTAEVAGAPGAIVHVAAELARREIDAPDFEVIRPTLEDAVVTLLSGGAR